MDFIKELLVKKGNSVWTIHPEDSIKKALELMKDKNVGALIVLDKKDSILGVFSERDFARFSAGVDKIDLSKKVKDVMTTNVICVNSEDTIDNCMTIMTEKRIRHLPVVEDKKLVGLVSIGDVVKKIIFGKEVLINQLENYIAGSL